MGCCRTLTPNFTSPAPNPLPRVFPNPSFGLRPKLGSKFPSLPSSSCISSGSRHRLRSFDAAAVASSEFPLLPFSSDEVLVPSETKKLHLYEARFLALLEESMVKNKLFVHFVLEPIITSPSLDGASFAARYGCLVLIESVERLAIGASVSIRGIGRVKIRKFVQADPYLIGVVKPLQDDIPDSSEKINSQVAKLKESLHQLNSLEIKLKPSKDEPLQTQITNSLRWAEKEHAMSGHELFFPSLAERLSFAGLQPASGASESEVLALQKEKLQAMEIRDTSKRLESTTEFVRQNISMVAAKLAIQSIGVQ